MTNTWKENLTWKSGLLSEIPVSRWGSIRGSKQVAILVFRRRGNGPVHPGNLILEQVIQPDGPPMRKSILDDPRQFVCVSVHLGLHTIPVDCAFTTRDMVNGSVVVHITYRVSNPETLVIGVEDALASLSLRCREFVTGLAEVHSFNDISTRYIKEVIEGMETNDLGLVITRVLVPDSITWPPGITEPQSEIAVIKANAARDEVATEVELAAKKRLAKLLEDKLRSMGITHPAILMRVLSRHDQDYQTILDAAQHFADSQKSSQDKARDLLVWLIEQDKVSRIEMGELVTGLIERVAGDVTALPDTVASLLTAPVDTPSLPEDSFVTSPPVTDAGSEDVGETREGDRPVRKEEEEAGHIVRRNPGSRPAPGSRKSSHSYVRRKREPK